MRQALRKEATQPFAKQQNNQHGDKYAQPKSRAISAMPNITE